MSRNNNAAYAPVPSDPSPPVLSLSEPQTWDSLRKTVKQLETELDAKLGGFSRLASASTTPYGGAGGSSATPQAEAAETDIDNVLKKLSTTIDAMSALLTPTSPPSSYHLVQRHRDLLFDNTREYRKIKANVIAAREQAELLSSVRNDISTHKNALSSGTDYYLSERNKIDSSHRMMDDAIEYDFVTLLLDNRSLNQPPVKHTPLGRTWTASAHHLQELTGA
ncbi:protein transport protein gos1 [Sorochytrium milnesiophthora]